MLPADEGGCEGLAQFCVEAAVPGHQGNDLCVACTARAAHRNAHSRQVAQAHRPTAAQDGKAQGAEAKGEAESKRDGHWYAQGAKSTCSSRSCAAQRPQPCTTNPADLRFATAGYIQLASHSLSPRSKQLLSTHPVSCSLNALYTTQFWR